MNIPSLASQNHGCTIRQLWHKAVVSVGRGLAIRA
jgi:hypothetical protein